MSWKEFLNKLAAELAGHLQKDLQYSKMARDGIRQIAWREIELFIEDFKNWPPEKLILRENTEISEKDREVLHKFIQKRLKNIPLAHILGKQRFYGLDYTVNKNTLIPRPETEELVEYLLHFIESDFKLVSTRKKRWPTVLIEIGTGSGCILTAILKNLPQNFEFSEIYAVEKSRNSLSIARKNIKQHLGKSYKIKFISGSMLDFISKDRLLNAALSPKPITACDQAGKQVRLCKTQYLIIANLPYLSEKEYENLSPEVKKYEPKNALIGGKEGQELICKLIDQTIFLKISCTLFLEISPTIYPKIKKHLAELNVPVESRIKHDLSGKIRILHLTVFS